MRFLILALALSSPAFADSFSKVTSPNILNENKATAVSLESGLQTYKARSPVALSIMLGAPISTKNVGPAVQADWTYRLSPTRPIFLGAGVGYLQETRNNSMGEPRNFHHIPVHLLGGYQGTLAKDWGYSAAAGPAVRHVFERGFTSSQNEYFSYGDLMTQVAVEYQMRNRITGSQQAFGLRHSRYFGLAGSSAAPTQDTISGSFSFDL